METVTHTASSPMYKRAEKVYPREVEGRFTRLRKMAALVLLGIYYGVPWISWNGQQAILFDLPARKFHLFGLTLWPQDLPLLAAILIIAALSLFFFTTIAGRLWCGYACPQTVWTEAYVWMEQITEGKRNRRMKLDQGSWTLEKIYRKVAKQVLWITFSIFTGLTFVGYFVPVKALTMDVLSLQLSSWSLFWVVFYSFATYGNAGFMREQVCKYMCPYARFQSAMFDKHTLIISYENARGEPRGRRNKKADPKALGLGDCIDCNMCVQVCPTGIDIRQGLQSECIACAACIDVCDGVMDKMNYPKGLIQYTTEHASTGQKSRLLRPRPIIYALLLLALLSGFAFTLLNRTPLILDVLRDRNALYRELPDSLIENVYTLKIVNMDNEDHTYTLTPHGLPGIRLTTDYATLTVPAGQILAVPTRIQVPLDNIRDQQNNIAIVISNHDGSQRIEEDTRFIAPVN